MTEISRSSLFGRLNPTAMKAIETATGLCRIRGNPYVEVTHWLHVLIRDPANDVSAMLRAAGIDEGRLSADVRRSLDRLPRGASAISDFAPQIEEAIEKGWMYASLLFGAAQIRTGHLLFAMLKTPTLRSLLLQSSNAWREVPIEQLGENFADFVAGSSEAEPERLSFRPVDGVAPQANGEEGSALSRFATDLTARAGAGKIDPIVGRDAEIRKVIDILLRRRQNNPILTGEAGVGKTAIAEGLARRIVDGEVPPSLADVSLYALDIGLLQAGASVKGEFEKRLRAVIDEVEGAARPIILFIDEAHTLIGAGGQAGTGDAANLLKPALARGQLRTIAATTWAEYRQHVEKDPALTRRFQPIAVEEPDAERAVAMLRSLKGAIETHHGVVILDEAVKAAVTLSQRYIPARQLPDKSVSLLDTAAARVAISQHATPAPVEDARRRIELLGLEREAILREIAGRYTSTDQLPALDAAIEEATKKLKWFEAKWAAESEAIKEVGRLRSLGLDVGALDRAIAERERARGEAPIVFGEVDEETIAAVVGDWTGIPVGRMVKDEGAAALEIEERLKRRVIGQDHAMDAIARRIRTTRAKLDNPSKPVGVFLLAGPTGVGKTETGHALSELLYASGDSLITINMSEYQEAHTVSNLKGAPAGYVGFGQGGVLTEAVRRRPYSVVLLDEFEKAHPDVHEMFFQVFDKGYMEDAEGRFIDFRNTLILLTSNVGSALITSLCADEDRLPKADVLEAALQPVLLAEFPPALVGRLVVLPFYPLSRLMLRRIVELQLNRIVQRIADNHGVALDYDLATVDLIVSRCQEVASGGRMIDAILTNTMLPDLSLALIERQIAGTRLASITVSADVGGFTYDFRAAEGMELALSLPVEAA